MPDRRTLILIATSGSAALMLGALAFQYIGGLPPCKLCYWQRYPHIAAIAIGAVGLLLPWALIAALGALSALATAAVGFYHVGVEQTWWDGPSSCSGAGSTQGLTPAELLDQILAAPVIRCDDIAWQLAGISMAGWNAIASLLLAAIWIGALRAKA